MQLQSSFGELTIAQLVLQFQHNQINLEPGFQRNSVWTINDRRRLVQSIVSAYPVPSIFLYKRPHKGGLVYDVIDGKQRLESIFMFTRKGCFHHQGFDVRLDFGHGVEWHDWKTLCHDHPDLQSSILGYKISTVEVTGDLSQIIDLFVRINSTGKRLTSGEKRHAAFYDSPFLAKAQHLVNKHKNYFLDYDILSTSQLDRMKGTELVSELLMSIHHGGIINKKTALDRAIGNESINGNTLNHLAYEFTGTLNVVRKVFPNLHQTRFHNTVDFYTLFMLMWEFCDKGFVLAEKKRNAMAERLLRQLSTGVDELRQAGREGRQVRNPNKLAQDYLPTVLGDTDSAATRERRATIIRGLLSSIFEFKAPQRIFSAEQRRILWNRDDRPLCKLCKKPITWADVTIDHIKAWVKGGSTSLKNGQLAHRDCNSSKGAG